LADTIHEHGFRVAAAIDFGTHSTGYAWAPVDVINDTPADRKIQFRTQWPDQPVPAAKVLSAVLLGASGIVDAWGYTARKRHRNSINALQGSSYYYGFKLALQRDAPSGPLLLPAQENAVAVAGGYLREIVREALRNIGASGYQPGDIRWCITVPAIWGDEAMSRTRQAAEAAGLPTDSERLLLVYEPEAAAVHCRIRGANLVGAEQDPGTVVLPASSRYMVVDCGGGTVDITSYRTDGSGQLEQIGQVSGGMLGSEYVNHAFITEIVADRLGGLEAVTDLARYHENALLQLVDAWEERKHTVAAVAAHDGFVRIDEPVHVPLNRLVYRALEEIVPDLSERLLRLQGDDNHIVMQPPELVKLFDSVVTRILDSVDEQLAAMEVQCGRTEGLETVLLVGGFAQSAYLQLRLSEHLRNRAHVRVPPVGAQAVLAGAVHICYNPELILARRSRYTYGFAIDHYFEQGVDEEDRKYISGYGETLCRNRFSKIVTINQTVPTDYEVKMAVHATGPDDSNVGIRLFSSTETDPRYVNGCTARGQFSVDMSSTAGKGLPIDERGVDLVFKFGGAEITVLATEVASGRTVSQVIRFEQQEMAGSLSHTSTSELPAPPVSTPDPVVIPSAGWWRKTRRGRRG
jgi:Hsp70 protein